MNIPGAINVTSRPYSVVLTVMCSVEHLSSPSPQSFLISTKALSRIGLRFKQTIMAALQMAPATSRRGHAARRVGWQARRLQRSCRHLLSSERQKQKVFRYFSSPAETRPHERPPKPTCARLATTVGQPSSCAPQERRRRLQPITKRRSGRKLQCRDLRSLPMSVTSPAISPEEMQSACIWCQTRFTGSRKNRSPVWWLSSLIERRCRRDSTNRQGSPRCDRSQRQDRAVFPVPA